MNHKYLKSSKTNQRVMKTIEERAKEYAKKESSISVSKVYNQALAEIYEEAYKTGATEQKEIDEEVRLRKCDEITKAEYDREVAFAEWYSKNGKSTPTFSDAIEWARKETIDKAKEAFGKACGWLNVYPWYIAVKDEFRKAMEE